MFLEISFNLHVLKHEKSCTISDLPMKFASFYNLKIWSTDSWFYFGS